MHSKHGMTCSSSSSMLLWRWRIRPIPTYLDKILDDVYMDDEAGRQPRTQSQIDPSIIQTYVTQRPAYDNVLRDQWKDTGGNDVSNVIEGRCRRY